MKPSVKLEVLAERELPKILSKIIVDEGDRYRVFGIYTIVPRSNKFTVSRVDCKIGDFSSTRNAISWIIADSNNRVVLAQEILTLDKEIANLKYNITLRKKLADKGNYEFQEIVNLKSQYRRDLCTQLETQLSKCINSAKYLQTRKS